MKCFYSNYKRAYSPNKRSPHQIMSFTTIAKLDQNMSIDIPYMPEKDLPKDNVLIKDFIAKQFFDMRVGEVSDVDLSSKKTLDGRIVYSSVVKFSMWYDTHYVWVLQDTIRDRSNFVRFKFNKDCWWDVTESHPI